MVYGKGYFDGNMETDIKFYKIWHNIFKRCFSESYHKQRPSYIGTTVCEEWYTFSNFKIWANSIYKDGYVLDKDFIAGDLKIYSPDTCAFIPTQLNNSLLERNNISETPLGVSKKISKSGDVYYQARISTFGKEKSLGIRDNINECHKLWQIAKRNYFIELSELYKDSVDELVIIGLQRRISILDYDIENDLITKTVNKI